MKFLIIALLIAPGVLFSDVISLGESLHQTKEEMQKISSFIENDLPHQLKTGKTHFLAGETGLACSIEYDTTTKRVFIHSKEVFSGGFSKCVKKSILYDREKPEIVARCQGPIRDAAELKIMQRLQNCPGIVEARGLIQRKNSIELFLKLYSAKSIRTIFKEKTYKLTLAEKIKIAQELIQGMHSMHKKGYIHRDLHSGNCLIDVQVGENGRIVKAALTDFGRTKRKSHCRGYVPQTLLRYRSPEAFQYKKLRVEDYEAGDLFSLGCVLYKLYYEREPPWFQAHLPARKSSGGKLIDLLNQYNRARRFELQQKVLAGHCTLEERFEYLIHTMLHPNAKKRQAHFSL